MSLALLAWVLNAAQNADVVTLWDPAPWQWLAAFALCLLPRSSWWRACSRRTLCRSACGVAIAFRKSLASPATPYFGDLIIWAAAHVPPNGRLVPVILFASMALFSMAGFMLLDHKARTRLGDETWRTMVQGTSVIPFAALLAGGARWPKLRSLAVPALLSALLFGWFVLQGHRLLIGPDPMPGLLAWF